jgi:hypothetical protein
LKEIGCHRVGIGRRAGWGVILVAAFAPSFAFCAAPPPSRIDAKLDPAGVRFFEQKIRPVLVAQCYECHSAQSKKARGGLRLDTRSGLLEGGDSGPSLVPGKPESSLLIKALRHEENAMPPKNKLADAIVADFVRWIEMGAPDPREGAVAKPASDADAGRAFWASQPPRRHAAPPVRDGAWPRTPIDRFVLAPLEAKGLRPARDADRPTLLRRLTLDLTGLPPTPEEVDAFEADRSPNFLERAVDRLLASPAFGERWGRHWLDLARYADSNGKDENFTFPQAWRFRDYVIGSFNADKPFDRLVREQIAGDLLPAGSPAVREEQLTATGFLVVGPKMLFDRDKLKQKMDVVDEQIDTVGRSLLGLTLGCARCHDHKFDPIPTKDYYAMAGVFASTRTLDGIKLGNPLISGWMLRPLGSDDEKAHAASLAHRKRAEACAESLRKSRVDLKVLEGKGGCDPRDLAALRQKIAQLQAEEAKLKATTPPTPRLVLAVRDEANPEDVPVNVRGNPHVPGEMVPRGFLTVASNGEKARIPANRSGRLELAEWLTGRENPLTARVFVNRVWMHLFGEGLVRTVDDFGARGTPPSHPELLDELALRFVEDGWSVKTLVRSLVLSRAYGLSASDDDNARIDPENRLFGRAHRRRLQAEVIRDAMLTVSGRLDRSMGGTSVAGVGEYATTNNAKAGPVADDDPRRSLYLPVIRNNLPGVFEVFDFADPDVATGRRDTTTVPTQALYLMNSPFVMYQARESARRLLAAASDDEGRLRLLYRLALGRSPTSAESRTALRYLREDSGEEAWAAVCQAVFGCTEFRFVE